MGEGSTALRARALFASQEGIVLAVTVLLSAGFAVMFPVLAGPRNLMSLIRSISIVVAWVIELNFGGMPDRDRPKTLKSWAI